MNNGFYLIITIITGVGCFYWGTMFNLQPVEQGIQMTAVESCNSLIKAEANGVYDPWTGLMFIRTNSRTEEAIYHTILHEIGHYHFGLDENLAETFAVNHKIAEVLK